MSLEMAHKVILPPKKNYIPQFLKQRDINSYYVNNYTPIVISTNNKKEQLTLLSQRKLALTARNTLLALLNHLSP
jgi:hypothetical protein